MDLYRAFTVRESFKNRDTVVVDWFCEKREEPVAPLEDLVANLTELTEEQRAEARARLDRLLTLKECQDLGVYIRATSGFEVKMAKIDLPIPDGRKAPDFSGRSIKVPGDYFPIHEQEEYRLGVPICGFADLSEPPNTHSMVHEG